MLSIRTIQGLAQRALLLFGLVCLLALAYSIFNRWGGLQDAAAWREALLFYVLPLGLVAAICFFCAFSRWADPLFCVLMFAAAYAALFVCEIYLQNLEFDQNAKRQEAARKLGYELDTREVADVAAALRREGHDAIAVIRKHSDPNLMPFGTVPNALAVVCNEFGPWYIVRSDRYGFKNPDKIWDDPGGSDVMVLGDSFAYGQCDPVTGGFADILRGKGLSVLNMSIGGNGPVQNLGTQIEYGTLKPPKYILWMHYAGNDLSGLTQFRSHAMSMRYVEDPGFRQNLPAKTAEIDQLLRQAEKDMLALAQTRPVKPGFIDYVTQPKFLWRTARLYALRATFGMARNTVDDTDFPLFQRIIERARDVARSQGAELIIVSIPAVQQLGKPEDAMQRETRATVESAGLRFYNLKQDYERQPDYRTLYAYGSAGGHLTPDGNRLTAELLLRILRP